MEKVIVLFQLVLYAGYGLGFLALNDGAGDLKYWIIGLLVLTFLSRGAVGMANQAVAAGDQKPSHVTMIIIQHWIFLLALIGVSLWSISR